METTRKWAIWVFTVKNKKKRDSWATEDTLVVASGTAEPGPILGWIPTNSDLQLNLALEKSISGCWAMNLRRHKTQNTMSPWQHKMGATVTENSFITRQRQNRLMTDTTNSCSRTVITLVLHKYITFK